MSNRETFGRENTKRLAGATWIGGHNGDHDHSEACVARRKRQQKWLKATVLGERETLLQGTGYHDQESDHEIEEAPVTMLAYSVGNDVPLDWSNYLAVPHKHEDFPAPMFKRRNGDGKGGPSRHVGARHF